MPRRIDHPQGDLFSDSQWCAPSDLSDTLRAKHYLGPTARGYGWSDEFGCLVLAKPTSRRLPTEWLELTRWCLDGIENGGSRQWSVVRKAIRERFPKCSTVVSYSDPSQGHTGALYRACGWVWAPTWHRVVTPPTGNGSWSNGKQQAAKDRWICLLRRDRDRAGLLRVQESYSRRFPWCYFDDRRGADFKTAKRHLWVNDRQGGKVVAA